MKDNEKINTVLKMVERELQAINAQYAEPAEIKVEVDGPIATVSIVGRGVSVARTVWKNGGEWELNSYTRDAIFGLLADFTKQICRKMSEELDALRVMNALSSFEDDIPEEVAIAVCYWDSEEAQRHELFAPEWFKDWMGEAEFCPANETRVSFQILNADRATFSGCEVGFDTLMESIRPVVLYFTDESGKREFLRGVDYDAKKTAPQIFLTPRAAMRAGYAADLPEPEAVRAVGICPICGRPTFRYPADSPEFCFECGPVAEKKGGDCVE